MANRYRPPFPTDPRIDLKRCTASVHDQSGWRPHQCNRKPWRDGWCKQHHPESVQARREASEARYRAEQARRAASHRRQFHPLQRELLAALRRVRPMTSSDLERIDELQRELEGKP